MQIMEVSGGFGEQQIKAARYYPSSQLATNSRSW